MVLACDNCNVNKPNRSCYYVQKGHGFWENIVSVNNSLHISYFYVCWSVVTRGCDFSAVYPKNNNVGLTRYKWLKKWKIHNIDLTQQFSLSIFTDFRYQSIKIAWLLSIFMDNDFYRLTTPGQTGKHRRVKFESKQKRLETLFTHRRLFNIYFHKLPFPCILDCTDNKTS